MSVLVGEPHCGACGQVFSSTEEMIKHIDGCEAVRASKMPAMMLMFGGNDPTHKAAHTLYATPKARPYIVEYARAVATEMRSFDRAQLHQRMCEKLGIPYTDFKPFEADDIDQVPTQKEAEDMIYRAIGKYMMNILTK